MEGTTETFHRLRECRGKTPDNLAREGRGPVKQKDTQFCQSPEAIGPSPDAGLNRDVGRANIGPI